MQATKILTEAVSFEFIRYANCWEDAELLLATLGQKGGQRILSVGSAGDNSFSLLTTQPELLVAVDVSQVQLYLIELKKAAFKGLDYDNMLALLGFRHSFRREKLYKEIRPLLSSEARQYWDRHLWQIQQGLIFQGKFEKYFQTFSARILPLIHNQKNIEELLAPKTQQEQRSFYNRKWNNRRWRLLFRIFFSRFVMGKLGRDPEFFRHVSVPVSTWIFNRAEQHLTSVNAQSNPFLHFILKGNFGDLLPHYARRENFQQISDNLGRLVLRKGYAHEVLDEYAPFNAFNLSNIFEYVSQSQFGEMTKIFAEKSVPGSRFAYWNLMVPRQLSSVSTENFHHESALSEAMTARDQGFFYSKFLIDQKL